MSAAGGHVRLGWQAYAVAGEPIERDEFVVNRDDTLRQVILVTKIEAGLLRGRYVLPDGQIESVADAPIELFRRASADEVRAADQRGQLPS
jgi:hypothetical protein